MIYLNCIEEQNLKVVTEVTESLGKIFNRATHPKKRRVTVLKSPSEDFPPNKPFGPLSQKPSMNLNVKSHWAATGCQMTFILRIFSRLSWGFQFSCLSSRGSQTYRLLNFVTSKSAMAVLWLLSESCPLFKMYPDEKTLKNVYFKICSLS